MRLAVVMFTSALALAQSGTVQPHVLSNPQPNYSEEARRARISTTIVLTLVVNTDGAPENIRVSLPAGFGLDEKAVEAVSTWRFEPGTTNGVKASIPVSVEVTFRLLNADGTTRLNFALSPGVSRPELLSGKMPPNPKEGENLRIALSVGPDGTPRDISVLDTSSPKSAEDATRAIKDWRFRPASLNGSPVEVKGVFELTRPAPRSPVSSRSVSGIGPGPSNSLDPSLLAPKLVSPADGVVFQTGYPRQTTCKWEPSPGAVAYLFEWDFSYEGVWDAEAKKRLGMGFLVQGTEYTFEFLGTQPGRWRVSPVSATGKRGSPSEWRGFRYLQ